MLPTPAPCRPGGPNKLSWPSSQAANHPRASPAAPGRVPGQSMSCEDGQRPAGPRTPLKPLSPETAEPAATAHQRRIHPVEPNRAGVGRGRVRKKKRSLKQKQRVSPAPRWGSRVLERTPRRVSSQGDAVGVDSPDTLPEGELPGTVCSPAQSQVLEDLSLPGRGHTLPRLGLSTIVQKDRMKCLEVRCFQ